MSDNKNQDVKLALDELRLLMAQTLQSGDSLDQKINNTLSAAGLIIAITSTLQISLFPNASNFYWAILILAVILYIATVGLALIGMKPQIYKLAIAADWDEIDERIFGKNEREALLVILSGYVEQIAHNEEINRQKDKVFRWNLCLLATMVLALLALVPISVIGI